MARTFSDYKTNNIHRAFSQSESEEEDFDDYHRMVSIF